MEDPYYTRTVKWDTDWDDIFDNIQVTGYWLDEDGNVFKEISQTDSDSDGKIDFTSTVTRAFDDGGLLKSELTQFDNFHDDRHDQAELAEYRYQDGEIIWFRSSSDHDANGTWDETYTQETKLDSQNRVIGTLAYTDWENDGTPDATVQSVYKYDAAGVLIFLGHDYGGDGSWNYTDEVVFNDETLIP